MNDIHSCPWHAHLALGGARIDVVHVINKYEEAVVICFECCSTFSFSKVYYDSLLLW